MIWKTLLLLSFFAAGTSLAASTNPKDAPIEIVGAEFGLFADGAQGERVLEPSAVVPNRVGQRFGWIIEVRTTRRSLAVREEYLLPAAPTAQEEADPVSEALKLFARNRRQVSQRQLVPMDGKISGEWTIGPNEAAGHRHLQVVIEGLVQSDFEFDVK